MHTDKRNSFHYKLLAKYTTRFGLKKNIYIYAKQLHNNATLLTSLCGFKRVLKM